MRKNIIIIIAFVCIVAAAGAAFVFFSGGLFTVERGESSGGGAMTQAAIEQEVAEGAYCETDSDCTVIYAPCPFGCHAAVNKNEAERLESLMQSYESDCVYGCIQAPPVQCVEQRCVLDTPKPGGGEEQSNASNENGEAAAYPVLLPAVMSQTYHGRNLALGEVLAQTNEYTRYYATYESGELTISGIMNIPAGEGPFPVIILNHGYIDPAVYTNGRGLRREQDYLARAGFAVLHIDYRNHAQSGTDPNVERDIRIGYVEDAINAVLAVKNSGITSLDTEKIGMLGHSMGGGVAQAVMVAKPDLVDAFVLYAPVSSDMVDNFNQWTVAREDAVAAIDEAHGLPADNPAFWRDISPRTFFEQATAPVRIFHGTNDADVPLAWSRETRDLLEEAGKDVELIEYAGEGHEFGVRHTDFMAATAVFFNEEL